MSSESQAESQLLRKRVLHPLGAGAGVGDHGADAGWEEAMTVSCPSAINLPKGKGGLGTQKGRRGLGVFQAPALGPLHEAARQLLPAGSSIFWKKMFRSENSKWGQQDDLIGQLMTS